MSDSQDLQEISGYAALKKRREEFVARQVGGDVVIWPDSVPWEQGRQGKLKYLLNPDTNQRSCTREWYALVQEIGERSGRHRHQGGLVIFALEGEGTTYVDGEALDWKEGDVVILPSRAQGVDHSHVNRNPQGSSFWLALINDFVWDQLGGEEVEQISDAVVSREPDPADADRSEAV